MPKMTFIERDGVRREVEAANGLSVLEIAHRHGVDIEGACEGSLACSTCHVIVDPEWYELLKTATEDEEDMLDLAFGLTHTQSSPSGAFWVPFVSTATSNPAACRAPSRRRLLLHCRRPRTGQRSPSEIAVGNLPPRRS